MESIARLSLESDVLPPLLSDPATIAQIFTVIENHEPGTPELLGSYKTHWPSLINSSSQTSPPIPHPPPNNQATQVEEHL